jgi:hypothetical protein
MPRICPYAPKAPLAQRPETTDTWLRVPQCQWFPSNGLSLFIWIQLATRGSPYVQDIEALAVALVLEHSLHAALVLQKLRSMQPA